jgi:hypothetical protein
VDFIENNLVEKQLLVKKNFGQHPVIRMTLADVTGQTLNEVLKKFRRQLIRTCLKFEYVLGTLFFLKYFFYLQKLDATKAKYDAKELGTDESSIFTLCKKLVIILFLWLKLGLICPGHSSV